MNMDRKTRAEERIEALDASPAALSRELDELRERLARAEQEAGESRAGWQRTAADFANYRRRTEQEREATLGLANELLLRKLLAVIDDFDRALGSMPRELQHLGWVEGVWLVERKMRALLESEGVTPIEAAGRPFDPHEHEAVVHEETSAAPDGSVLSELQKGYRIRDRVLRPALVTVAKNSGASTGGTGTPRATTDDTDQSTRIDGREAASGGND